MKNDPQASSFHHPLNDFQRKGHHTLHTYFPTPINHNMHFIIAQLHNFGKTVTLANTALMLYTCNRNSYESNANAMQITLWHLCFQLHSKVLCKPSLRQFHESVWGCARREAALHRCPCLHWVAEPAVADQQNHCRHPSCQLLDQLQHRTTNMLHCLVFMHKCSNMISDTLHSTAIDFR